MKLPSQGRTHELEVKMTPMIDVVFLLLVFFVWTSSFEIPEFDVPGPVAEATAGGSSENADPPPDVEAFDELVVRLLVRDGLPAIELGGERVASEEDLAKKISEVVELGVQPPVIVDPEPEVTMERTIRVYDAVRNAGADRVLFALSAE